MSRRLQIFWTVVLCATIGALFDVGAAPAAKPAPAPAAPVPVVIPKSIFDDPGLKPNLHDPFFPKTKRPPYVPIAPVRPTNAPVVVKVDPYDGVLLKGITGGSRKLVIINNQTLAVGESAVVKRAEGSPVEVQVMEIKAGSAVIKASGAEAKEIFLKKSL